MTARDIWRLGGLLAGLFGLILVPFAIWGDQLEAATLDWMAADQAALVGWGAAALLALDIALPLPSSLIAAAAGAALGLAPGAFAVWAGLMVSCLAGYAIGRYGGTPLLRWFLSVEAHAATERQIAAFGVPLLLMARAVPVLAEASVLTAGSLRMAFWPFLWTVAAANAVLAVIYAAIGALAASSQMGWIVLVTLAVPAAAWLVLRGRTAS